VDALTLETGAGLIRRITRLLKRLKDKYPKVYAALRRDLLNLDVFDKPYKKSCLGQKARENYWVSMDGRSTLIADMDETHVKNALALIISGISSGKLVGLNQDTGAIKQMTLDRWNRELIE
jgi:hypothetical protein